MNDPILKTYQDNFDQLLLRHPPQSLLPDLIEEKKADLSWWQEFLQKLKDWFQHQNPKTSNWMPDYQNFVLFLKYLLFILVALLAAYLLYLLLRSFKRDKSVPTHGSSEAAVTPPKINSPEAYQLALQAHDFSLAARLYWKDFLKSRQLPRSMTPEEWKCNFNLSESSDLLQKISKLMFGDLSQPEAIFKEWVNWMERMPRA
ncbi:MAG: hypothetical protein HQM15_00895 [Deltaproteobacteria bacterium]|nr:hypothetical protein [Deltaproteobacteria bacterium]